MIITISGVPGAGKTVVGKGLAKKLRMKKYSSGDFMRQLAREHDMTLLEFSKLAEKDRKIDLKVDSRMRKLGREEDNFVIDSRLGFKFIPKSLKIFLHVEIEEAAKRIFKDTRKGERNTSLKKTLEDIKKRMVSEKKRYKKYYGINPYEHAHYDILFDTTGFTIQQCVDKLAKLIKAQRPKHI